MSASGSTPDDSKKNTQKKSKRISDTDKSSNLTNNRTKLAKKAFSEGDIELSSKLHDNVPHAEKHKKGGEFIKSIVYGGLDGCITTFAVAAGAAGAGLSSVVVLIMGFSHFADAIGMGVCDYLSEKAENDFARAEKRREAWEFDNFPEGEVAEMVEIYEEKGLTHEEAEELVNVLAKNKENMVNVMMIEELGMMPPGTEGNPMMSGFITFISFILFALVPMLPYVIASIVSIVTHQPELNYLDIFGICCAVTALTMFTLGAITSRFTTQTWYTAGFLMFVVGALAAVVSYFFGWAVNEIINAIAPPAPLPYCNNTST